VFRKRYVSPLIEYQDLPDKESILVHFLESEFFLIIETLKPKIRNEKKMRMLGEFQYYQNIHSVILVLE
jgi:hypothetical protein